MLHDSPDVGANLLDHLVVPLGFEVPDDTLFAAEKPVELSTTWCGGAAC